MLKQLVATFECFNNVFKGFPKIWICILHTLHILFILPNPSHWGAASERNFPGKGGLQTWNLSNKFTRPNFWTTKFTLSKRVNCDCANFQQDVLFSREIYTAGKYFTQPLVVTVATNFKSGGLWHFLRYPCHHFALFADFLVKWWLKTAFYRTEYEKWLWQYWMLDLGTGVPSTHLSKKRESNVSYRCPSMSIFTFLQE